MMSHPEKVLFPEVGITKGELGAYYQAIAPLMLPHLRGRPVTMERYPAGIDKKGFIQKDVSKGFPDWLARVAIDRKDERRAGRKDDRKEDRNHDGKDEKGGDKESDAVHYPLANDDRALLWMANQNCITPHVWTARLPDLRHPDLCVFDLDPARDDPRALRDAALAVRDLLGELGLPSFIKTSGSKGFHILVPLDAAADFEAVWHFAHGVGAVLVKRHPETLTQEFIKADRAERIFVDTGRNGHGATFAAVYAVRPKPEAPVSAPCRWEEVEREVVGPRTFTLRTMANRIAATGDLWADMDGERRSLDGAMTALAGMLTEDDWRESFAAATRRPTSRKAKPSAVKRPARDST